MESDRDLLAEFSGMTSIPPELPSRIEASENEIDHLLKENGSLVDIEALALSLITPSADEENRLQEDKQRVIRRLEKCAKAREENTKIMSLRCLERDDVKTQMLRERNEYQQSITRIKKERVDRWTRKTAKSPFNVDLVAEHQRVDEENRVLSQLEMRKNRLLARREKEAHVTMLKRAVETTDELGLLRQEKRLLLENEKKLKAMRDLEKANTRSEMVFTKRRQKKLDLLKKKESPTSVV